MYKFIFLNFVLVVSAHTVEKGVALEIHAGKPSLAESIADIRVLGAKMVLMKWAEFQNEVTSSDIFPDPLHTPAYEQLRRSLRQAKKQGLSVMAMPILLLRNNQAGRDWRALLKPQNLDLWKASYRSMILKYAKLLQAEHVDYLSVGSELSSLEYEVDFWQKLIQDVRRIYKGKLFYSFNWDHLSTTVAWKNLDYLALSAYFELLKPGEHPTDALLNTRWNEIHRNTQSWASGMKKRIIYSEIGYPSRDGALNDPWFYDKPKATVNNDLQLLAFGEFIKNLPQVPWLHAVIFYEWNPLDTTQVGYTPHNKPIMNLWKKWFTADDTKK